MRKFPFFETESLVYGRVVLGTLGKESLVPPYPNSAIVWHKTMRDLFSNSTWIATYEKENKYQENFLHASLTQVHGKDIHCFSGEISPETKGDGLYTELQKAVLWIRTADCLPVFLYSRKQPWVALIHSGWKGTALGIVEKAIESFMQAGGKLEDLQITIGAYIHGEDYEVDWDVASLFFNLGNDVVYKAENQKYKLDVGKALESRLAIVYGNNLSIKNQLSSVFQSESYFSHRAKEEGRNLNFIFWES